MGNNVRALIGKASASVRSFVSGYYKILCYLIVVLAVFIVTLVCGPSLGNAIQASAVTVLVIITAQYAASTKRMAKEAELSRQELAARYGAEERQRVKAMLSHLLLEAKLNMEVFKHYDKPFATLSNEIDPMQVAMKEMSAVAREQTGQRPIAVSAEIFPFRRFRVTAGELLADPAPQLADLIPRLHQAYFVMELVNALIDEYHLRGGMGTTPHTIFQQVRNILTESNFLALLRQVTQGLEDVEGRLLAQSREIL